eukprot:COSAG02_NODE_2171_length_9598_cov_30.756817_2_plen_333_part_00
MQRDVRDARRLKLTVEYDGAAYKGWQRQTGQPSVQAAIERAICQLTSEREDELAMRVAGRTDAGVHAMGQVCSVLTRYSWERSNSGGEESGDQSEHHSGGGGGSGGGGAVDFGRLVNTRLPADIAIVGVEEVPLGWVPYRCLRKRYRYKIVGSRSPEPAASTKSSKEKSGERMRQRQQVCRSRLAKCAVGRQYVWQCPWPLSLELMQRGAAALEGEHDFTSFCHSSEKENDNVINVESITVTALHAESSASGDEAFGTHGYGTMSLALDFVSHGFRMHMVRNLVGILVDIGKGARLVEDLPAIFAAKDRTSAIVGQSQGAPAHGLSLISVEY